MEKKTIKLVREAVNYQQTHIVVVKVVVRVAGILAQRLVGFAFKLRLGYI